MQLPTGQLDTLRTDAAALLDACTAAGIPAEDSETGLAVLAQAFDQLFEVLARAESDLQSGGNAGASDVTELGEYALQLIENLAARVGQTGDDSLRQRLAMLTVNLALWIARHDGVIDTLEPVVDALALFANTTSDTHALADLHDIIGTIVEAVSPVISQDLEKINPGRPWRVLLLNQSIVATRSHNTALMEQAFARLTDNLPGDAARFFTEGMQQMDALDYPQHVREVMARYHRQWNVDRSLH
ncbi:MAG: hypothetical protein KJO66_00105 [Gammaproteobacteria bacterium]|nr:hypothetical protein [Gammaproteobacteria bacterium]